MASPTAQAPTTSQVPTPSSQMPNPSRASGITPTSAVVASTPQSSKPPSIVASNANPDVDVPSNLETRVPSEGLSTELSPTQAFKEQILKDVLKEKEFLIHENGLLRDHLARIVEQAAAQADEDSQSMMSSDEEEDEEIQEYESRSSFAKNSFIGGGFSVESSEEEYNISEMPLSRLNAEEKNDIASKENAKLHEEMDECRNTNERMLDELRSAYDESELRIGEVRRDRADFQRDVMGDAQNKGFRRANAHKVLKFLEAKIKYKVAKAKKVHERNQALHVVIARTGKQLGMKKELADVLHAVDFEQLHIHKQQNQQRLSDRNHELQRLKSSHAKALEALENTSCKLLDLMNNRNQTLDDLSNCEPQLAHVKKDISRISLKKERLEELFHIFVQERDAQLGESQPNVLDYMQLKDRVHTLRREHKKWNNKVEVAELCYQQASNLESEKAASTVNDPNAAPNPAS